MAVVISEIVTEVVVGPSPAERAGAARRADDDDVIDEIVRRAAERVLEILRREWDR